MRLIFNKLGNPNHPIMIQKTIVSFFDNLKTKTTNPFLGTLILVWIYRNYENFYVLFFSGSATKYPEKIAALHGLYKTENFVGSFFVTIAITILVLIGTYALLNISRFIVNMYNKKLTPWIYKITDKSSVVLKHEYDKVVEVRDRYQIRFEDERKERFRAEGELEDSVKKVGELEKKIQDSEDVKKLSHPPQSNNGIDVIEEERKQFDEVLNTLKQGDLISDFETILMKIGEGNMLRNSSTNELLKKLDIIVPLGDTKYYKLTDKGEKLKYYYFREVEQSNSDQYSGNRRFDMNISVDQKEEFFKLLGASKDFSGIKHSHHDNKNKTQYFTFIIKDGNDRLFNDFREFLSSNDIKYDDYG